MVIGIDHLHIHNGKFAPYVEVCGPQGPIFEYKGAVFFLDCYKNLFFGFFFLVKMVFGII